MTQRMLDSYEPVSGIGDIVKDFTTDGFAIRLYQSLGRMRNSYAVQYGKQLDERLYYADACAKLGEAIMHDLACQSLLDNERD